MATLDGLAFEGATKRNRPNLKVRVALCFPGSQPDYRSPCLGWIPIICSGLFGPQGHGAGVGMLRRPNA